MTFIEEAMEWADAHAGVGSYSLALAAEVRRLQSEVERLPARRAQPTVKTAPIAPTNWPFWGIDETDEEFAERVGGRFLTKTNNLPTIRSEQHQL